MQSAEKLSFLNEQELYDLERQFHLQEVKLTESQNKLKEKEREIEALHQEIAKLQEIVETEQIEASKERKSPQWKLVTIPAGTEEGDDIEKSLQRRDSDVTRIQATLEEWGSNKSRYFVEKVEDWLQLLLSGKSVAMENGENTIQLNMFDQKQRDSFMRDILPLIVARKNLECFVQEHKRREFDFRITVLNKDETIPAICVPREEEEHITEKVETVETVEEHPDVVFVPETVEEESTEELRISEMDAISHEVMKTIPAVKERRRKAKIINLD